MKDKKMTWCFHVTFGKFKENPLNQQRKSFLNLHGQFEKLYQDIQTFLSNVFLLEGETLDSYSKKSNC